MKTKETKSAATTTPVTSTPVTTAPVDPKAELKALAARRKELREQVKKASEAAKEERKAESKEVTLRWIKTFSDRIARLDAKKAKAIELRAGLIQRAQKNGWLQ